MTDVQATTFESIWGGIAGQIEPVEQERRRVAGRARWIGAVVIVATIVLALVTLLIHPLVSALIIVAGFAAWHFLVSKPLGRTKSDMKLPILQAISRATGCDYVPHGFEPNGFATAETCMFNRVTGYNLTDRFTGTIEGRPFAVYEGLLTETTGYGKNRRTRTVFQGQFFWLQRSTPVEGSTVAVPDRGAFNFFKPRSDLQRVAFTDEDFDKKFEVYSTHPQNVGDLFPAPVRAQLLQMRGPKGMFVYLGAHDLLVALPGHNRFEPGDMMKKIESQDRARQMYGDVTGAVEFARRINAAFPDSGWSAATAAA